MEKTTYLLQESRDVIIIIYTNYLSLSYAIITTRVTRYFSFFTYLKNQINYTNLSKKMMYYEPHIRLMNVDNPSFTTVKLNMTKKKKPTLDPEELALIEWCIEVEHHLVSAGVSTAEAQDYIEEEAEWLTDLFFDGLSPEQAAKESLA